MLPRGTFRGLGRFGFRVVGEADVCPLSLLWALACVPVEVGAVVIDHVVKDFFQPHNSCPLGRHYALAPYGL